MFKVTNEKVLLRGIKAVHAIFVLSLKYCLKLKKRLLFKGDAFAILVEFDGSNDSRWVKCTIHLLDLQ